MDELEQAVNNLQQSTLELELIVIDYYKKKQQVENKVSDLINFITSVK